MLGLKLNSLNKLPLEDYDGAKKPNPDSLPVENGIRNVITPKKQMSAFDICDRFHGALVEWKSSDCFRCATRLYRRFSSKQTCVWLSIIIS